MAHTDLEKQEITIRINIVLEQLFELREIGDDNANYYHDVMEELRERNTFK